MADASKLPKKTISGVIPTDGEIIELASEGGTITTPDGVIMTSDGTGTVILDMSEKKKLVVPKGFWSKVANFFGFGTMSGAELAELNPEPIQSAHMGIPEHTHKPGPGAPAKHRGGGNHSKRRKRRRVKPRQLRDGRYPDHLYNRKKRIKAPITPNERKTAAAMVSDQDANNRAKVARRLADKAIRAHDRKVRIEENRRRREEYADYGEEGEELVRPQFLTDATDAVQ